MNALRPPTPLPFVVRRPALVLTLAALVTLIAGLSMLRLRPEASLQKLLDARDPSVAAMSRVMHDFPVVNDLLVFAELSPEATSNDPAPLVAFAERLRSAIDAQPNAGTLVASVGFRTDPETREFFERVVVPGGLYYLDSSVFTELKERLTPGGMRAQLARSKAVLTVPGPGSEGLGKAILKDPLRLHEFLRATLSQSALALAADQFGNDGLLLSTDGRALLIRVTGLKGPDDLQFCRDLTALVATCVNKADPGTLKVSFAGAYAIAAYNVGAIRSDSILGISSSLVSFVVLFAVLYRKPIRIFLLAMLPVTLGLVCGFGAYAAFTPSITPLAAVVGGTLSGIGIDYSIHFLAHYEQARRRGHTSAESAAFTITHMKAPMFAACITSVIGLAAIVFSPVRVLRDFAVIGSISLLACWLATLVVLPAALIFLDRIGWQSKAVTARWVAPRSLAVWLTRHSRTLVTLTAIASALVITAWVAGGARPNVDSELTSLHPRPNPPLDAQREITRRMGLPADSVLIHLRADSSDDLLRLAHRVRERLSSQRMESVGVRGSFSLASFLPDPDRAAARAHEIDPAWAGRVTSDFQTAAESSAFRASAFAAYSTFLSQLLTPGPPPTIADLSRYSSVGRMLLPYAALAGAPATESLVTVVLAAPVESHAAREDLLSTLRDSLTGLDGVSVTGTVAITHDVEAAIQHEVPTLLAVAMLAILIFLLVHFRSLRLALIAAAPAIISLLGLLVFMRLVGQRINLVNLVMLPLLMGITVDYGVFAASLVQNRPDLRTLLRQFSPGCTAMIVCASTTILGFGSLVLTSVPAVRSLGTLINVGLIVCVLVMLAGVWPLSLWAAMRARR